MGSNEARLIGSKNSGMTKSAIYQIATNVFFKYNKKPPRKDILSAIYSSVEELNKNGEEISKAKITNIAEDYFRNSNR